MMIDDSIKNTEHQSSSPSLNGQLLSPSSTMAIAATITVQTTTTTAANNLSINSDIDQQLLADNHNQNQTK